MGADGPLGEPPADTDALYWAYQRLAHPSPHETPLDWGARQALGPFTSASGAFDAALFLAQMGPGALIEGACRAHARLVPPGCAAPVCRAISAVYHDLSQGQEYGFDRRTIPEAYRHHYAIAGLLYLERLATRVVAGRHHPISVAGKSDAEYRALASADIEPIWGSERKALSNFARSFLITRGLLGAYEGEHTRLAGYISDRLSETAADYSRNLAKDRIPQRLLLGIQRCAEGDGRWRLVWPLVDLVVKRIHGSAGKGAQDGQSDPNPNPKPDPGPLDDPGAKARVAALFEAQDALELVEDGRSDRLSEWLRGRHRRLLKEGLPIEDYDRALRDELVELGRAGVGASSRQAIESLWPEPRASWWRALLSLLSGRHRPWVAGAAVSATLVLVAIVFRGSPRGPAEIGPALIARGGASDVELLLGDRECNRGSEPCRWSAARDGFDIALRAGAHDAAFAALIAVKADGEATVWVVKAVDSTCGQDWCGWAAATVENVPEGKLELIVVFGDRDDDEATWLERRDDPGAIRFVTVNRP